ncbi:hypothetical protein FB451DRAFT_1183585 [Mycena latifolia]|nr:hypothetical protein FB451DRAFT_1183585 [Mycena latifolia]
MSSPPPPYEDAGFEALITALGRLEVTVAAHRPTAAARPQRAHRPPRADITHSTATSLPAPSTTSTAVPHGFRPATPTSTSASHNEPLYRYQSPTQSGYTSHWVPLRDDVKPNVLGVHGSLYQGYMSQESAQAAYEYARHRSWTRAPIPALPSPVGTFDTPNPLHVDGDDGRWVFSGVWKYESVLGLPTYGSLGSLHNCTTVLLRRGAIPIQRQTATILLNGDDSNSHSDTTALLYGSDSNTLATTVLLKRGAIPIADLAT